MADQTFGQMLLNEKLPEDLRFDGPVTKGDLRKRMTEYAKRDPKGYVQAVQDVKEVGDKVSTWEGISVGLDDIAPDYENRDTILNDAMKKVRSASSDEEKRKILYDTEDKIKKVTEDHPSDMTLMAKSGGRGSIAQLMKTVASPVVASDADGKAYPWLIKRSYAQGLSPSETWVSGSEARRNAIASTGSVVEPGAVAKVVVSNMEDLVVTKEDCGTRAGLQKDVDNKNVIGRYLAESAGNFNRNDLVTPDVVSRLKKAGIEKIEVRSPMTCDVNDGVCKKCMGQNSWGKDYETGMNVGSRSAQALTEPLTQFALNAKHGVRMVGGDDNKHELTGLKGFRTLTEVPKSFNEKAALAKHDGKVTKIQPAPQGGHNIFVSGTRHYTPPGLDPTVEVGDLVEKGDALSDGTPMPDEVVEAKGVGEGRRYLSESLNKLYERQGVDIDHRHTELLARKAMNYVQIEDDPTDTLLEGDVVPFEKVKPLYRKNQKEVSIDKAEGKYLAEPILHYNEGTRITPSVITKLKDQGVKRLQVAKNAPEFKPIMKSMIRTPLLKEDWMSRLSHRYLKKTLTEGAGFGYESDTESTNPVPAYVANSQFGHTSSGKYACLHGKQLSREKAAAIGNLLRKGAKGAKNVLFGKGKGAVDDLVKNTRNQGGDMIRHIGDTGALDETSFDARYWQDWMGRDKFDELGFVDDAGVLTQEGAQKLRQVEDAASKGFGRRRMEYDDVAKKMLDQGDHNLSKHFDEDTWKAMQENRGSAWRRGGTLAKNVLFGDRPLDVIRQRYARGGVLGRGGVVWGDLGMSPDMARAYKDFRAGGQQGKGSIARMAMHGLNDVVMNKTMSYGIPAASVYHAATADPEEQAGSQALNIATPIAETTGWGAATPFGMAGGSLLAAPFVSGVRHLVGEMDPEAKKQLQREKGIEPEKSVKKTRQFDETPQARQQSQQRAYSGYDAAQRQAYQDWRNTLQAHPWYSTGGYAGNYAQNYYQQTPQIQQKQQVQRRPAQQEQQRIQRRVQPQRQRAAYRTPSQQRVVDR